MDPLEPFAIEGELAELNADDLAEAIEAAGERLDAFLALEDPSDQDVANAEATNEVLASLRAEAEQRQTAATQRTERMAALRDSRQPEPDVEPEPEPQPVTASVEQRRRIPRPEVPPPPPASTVTITAAADLPNFSTGAEMADLDDVAKAVISRVKAFPKPSGRGELMRYGTATFAMQFDEGLVASGGNDLEVFLRASREDRLDGNSLTAAGGWCAPSETLYEIPGMDASTDGLLDLPEVQVSRGGIRFTGSPDFASLYTNTGFTQTEAQAIAGTAKPCFEVDCPTFEEVRLDATGLCIKVPILTNAGYPEWVRETIAGALVAQQHRESADMINRLIAKADAAITVADVGSVAGSTLDAVDLIAQTLRSDYRLSLNATLEVLAPFWLKSAIRADLAMRTGVNLLSVSDADIEGFFADRNVRVQWLYNWQNLVDGQEGYPATANLVMYPAGTFVKGVADVITLDTVYDAASLVQNVYTGLFAERGILLAKMSKKAKQFTVSVKSAGITGAANSTASFDLAP